MLPAISIVGTQSAPLAWAETSGRTSTQDTRTRPYAEQATWYESWWTGPAASNEISGSWIPDTDRVTAFALGAIAVAPSKNSRPKAVKVPSNYVYCTTWYTSKCKPKTLHDYCSWSPDEFGYTVFRVRTYVASFRGPCARHDLAIGVISKKKISVKSKRAQRSEADRAFKSNLRSNCRHGMYGSTPGKNACYARAELYYAAVSRATSRWNGK